VTLTCPISMRTRQQTRPLSRSGFIVLACAGLGLSCGRTDPRPAAPVATVQSQFVAVPGPPVYPAHDRSLTDLCPERIRDGASSATLVRAVATVAQETRMPGDSSLVTEATATYIPESLAGRAGAIVDSVHVDCRTLRRIDPPPALPAHGSE
jgi:hypothetical protein